MEGNLNYIGLFIRNHEGQQQCNNIFKVLKEKKSTLNPEFYTKQKYSLEMKAKTFSSERKLREFLTNNPI